MDTKGVREWLHVFRRLTMPIIRKPEEQADTIVWLGAELGASQSSGQFWHGRRPRPMHYRFSVSSDARTERQRFRDACEC